MEDQLIIDMYFKRSEKAIAETKAKYGHMLCRIAFGILRSRQDAEECETDTYMKTWNVIPPTKPQIFPAFLSKITRNLSLDRYDELHAKSRGSGEIPILLDELEECIPDRWSAEEYAEETELKEQLNSFLSGLKPDARMIFMRRYWFGDRISEISSIYGYGSGKIKMSLMRSRKELKERLEKEGYTI